MQRDEFGRLLADVQGSVAVGRSRSQRNPIVDPGLQSRERLLDHGRLRLPRLPHAGFDGTYFYGDYCAGSVLSLQVVGGTATNEQNWTSSLGGGLLTSFGVDAQGEMYIVVRSGTVYKIVPPLPAMEVSGAGAGQPLLLDATGDWTWEDLQYSSMQPISSYHVYRADVLDGVFNAGETFNCVHATTMTSWPGGGDPQNPAAGQMFAYVVVGQNGSGEQTDPGGTPSRTLSAASCP